MHDTKCEKQNKPILIIPAAGRSSRYPDMKPKWMLTHPSGKLMIEKVIDGLNVNDYKEIYFVILREHCVKYEADLILKQAFPDNIFNITILENPTLSSPETVYECISQNNISGGIVVKDCDCLVSYNIPQTSNFIVGLSLTNNVHIKNLQQKSFIISNHDNIVQEIIEKQIASDNVCLGVYGMKAEDMIISYKKLLNILSKEMYFSHIISDLIDTYNKIFTVVEANDFIDWGTKEEWFSSTTIKNTYLLDIDGIVLFNTGKYGSENWFNIIKPIEENVKIIKQLSDQGHEIIFITSRTQGALLLFEEFLKERKIIYKTIIHSCLHSKRILVNDFASSNPFPSCLAINIPRNQPIEPYLK
jgi:hypothetical protein